MAAEKAITQGVLRRELRTFGNRLDARFNTLETRLNTKIDGVDKRLDTKIDDVRKGLDSKIDGVNKGLIQKIDETEKRLNTRMDSQIDMQTELLKDFVGFRLSQSETRFQTNLGNLEKKLDVSVKGLVEMIERSYLQFARFDEAFKSHERRLVALESKS